ncbi:MAG: cytochrome c [Chromatiales bacterium]|nr:cytochrome c [Chromatiales bacterium]
MPRPSLAARTMALCLTLSPAAWHAQVANAQTQTGTQSASQSPPSAPATTTGTDVTESEAAVDLGAAVLEDPDRIAEGKALWGTRCKFCHGKTAYPGKAPKLRPKRYTADFVYDRVTNGFRGMPSWKHEFDQAQRQAITAYVMSKGFSN